MMQTGLPAGGSETQMVRFAHYLITLGHRVSILTHLGDKTTIGKERLSRH